MNGAVGNDFVCIHVGLRARARLPDTQREVLVKRTGDDLRRDMERGGSVVQKRTYLLYIPQLPYTTIKDHRESELATWLATVLGQCQVDPLEHV